MALHGSAGCFLLILERVWGVTLVTVVYDECCGEGKVYNLERHIGG